MNISLQGRSALVCGSSKGIGRSTAIALSRLGASVILLARNRQALDDVAAELDTDAGQQHQVIVVDFMDIDDLKQKVEALARAQTVDILINNTGGPKGGPILDADLEQFGLAYRMHLMANHTLAQTLIPGMREQGYGRIVNVISTSVKVPIAGLGVSNTTRGAVASWAKTLAGEVGRHGITVNNVLPGFTDTERLAEIISARAQKQDLTPDQVKTQMLSGVPARRFASPDETADAIAFLASPAAGYINGINLPVDGGRTGCL